ncbi:MAG: hypothetical protein NZ958_07970 [Bacteroidia bacterium]|nr:hypothetical protein [Bacteroidia bacterium]MDW8088583.1 hypothetical protein [Bacteroidia bacterium]
MRWVAFLLVAYLSAQSGGYDPNEVIGESEGETPSPVVVPREDIAIQINGQPFQWQDPLVIEGGKTYHIYITGMRPHSKLILRFFKAGQSAGGRQFDANEYGELELEARLEKQKVQGIAEVIYYPSNGREVRRRFKVKIH